MKQKITVSLDYINIKYLEELKRSGVVRNVSEAVNQLIEAYAREPQKLFAKKAHYHQERARHYVNLIEYSKEQREAAIREFEAMKSKSY